MKEKMPNSFLMVFATLIFLTVFVFSKQASGQVRTDKPKAPGANSVEALQNSSSAEMATFCGSVGGCRDSEIQPCTGWGPHICVTINSVRYFCHDCSGSGECQKDKYCSRDSWRCDKIKGK